MYHDINICQIIKLISTFIRIKFLPSSMSSLNPNIIYISIKVYITLEVITSYPPHFLIWIHLLLMLVLYNVSSTSSSAVYSSHTLSQEGKTQFSQPIKALLKNQSSQHQTATHHVVGNGNVCHTGGKDFD